MKDLRLFAVGYWLLATAVLFTGCEKPVEPIMDQELALKASADSIICEPQSGDVTALQLTWTAGSNHGTGSAISYTIDMTMDSVAEKEVHFAIGRTSDRNLTLSHIQMADTLWKYFPQMTEKQFYSFTFRVRADIKLNGEELVSNSVKVVIARYPSVLTLLVHTDTVECFSSLADKTAMQLRWTPANDHGMKQAIAYTLDIDRDSSFTQAIHFTPDSMDARTLEITHAELAETFAQAFPAMEENRFYTLYIRVCAKIGETDEQQFSLSKPVQMCRYTKEVSPLLLIGDATPNGWNMEQAVCMPLDKENPNMHVWEGVLKRGEFKMLVSADDWFPCYVCNYDKPTRMVRRDKEDDGYYDFKWYVPNTGVYRLVADTKEMTLSMTCLSEGGFLYLVGDATPYGWERDNAARMERDGQNPNIHSWQGTLKRGEFKLLTSTEDWFPCYVRNSSDASKMEYNEKEGDHEDLKWNIPSSGTYRIEADTKLQTVSVTYINGGGYLYLVGDATPHGWERDNAAQMERDAQHPDIHTWQGTLKRGEFKLLTTLTDWNPCYVRNSSDASKMVYNEKEGDHEDLKWYVPNTGEYRIEVNTGALSISVTCMSEGGGNLYLVGDATPSGWERDKAICMEHDTQHPDIHTWQGKLKPGEFKLLTTTTDWFPSYARDNANASKMVYRENEAIYYDFKWNITVVGEYRIEADTKQQTISVKYVGGGGNLYLVGDAMPNGWDRSLAIPMDRDGSDDAVYTWQGTLKRGEFKLLTTLTDWNPCYVRNSGDASKMEYNEKEGDHEDLKWNIRTAGEYKIEVNTGDKTIRITFLEQESYSHIYMIGDATPNGWNWDNITELDHPEAHIFTYEGDLKEGSIKFPTEIKTDWTGEILFAPTAECTPGTNGKYDAHKGGDDYKWVIPSAGKWHIRIDTNKEIISFTRL